MGGVWGWVWALASTDEIRKIAVEIAREVAATEEQKGLFMGAGSVSEKGGWGKAAGKSRKRFPKAFTLHLTYIWLESMLG